MSKNSTIVFLILLMHFQLLWADPPVRERYNVNIVNKTIKEAFIEVKRVTGYSFSYRTEIINPKTKVTIVGNKLTIRKIVSELLKDQNVLFSIRRNVIIIKGRKKKVKKKFTISGMIQEDGSSESLIGASVYVSGSDIGTTSNNYGFYSLSLPAGKYIIVSSYSGCYIRKDTIELNNDIRKDINLKVVVHKRSEQKELTSNRDVKELPLSMTALPVKEIELMPSLLGEVDVLESLRMLPGIQGRGDIRNDFNVRGGAIDENLILLDDAPIYNPSHVLGFFSMFNSDAIKDIKVYKGGIPAQYGSRTSSVVDIRMNDGNMKKYEGHASLGTLASKVSFQGPVKKDVASFMISGRYSYAGFSADNAVTILNGLGMKSGEISQYKKGNEVNFYDINLKLNYKYNDNNRFYISAYAGKDNFYYMLSTDKNRISWGNYTATLRWNHIYTDRLFSNTTASFSKYGYSYSVIDGIRDYKWSSLLREFNVKTDYDFFINSNSSVKFGLGITGNFISPGELKPESSTSVTSSFSLGDKSSYEPFVYLSHTYNVGTGFSLEYGLRYSANINTSGGIVYSYTDEYKTQISSVRYNKKGSINTFYHGLEPRLNVTYRINNTQSLKASYTRTRQYLRLLSSSGIGMPIDVWYPVDNYIKPQITDLITFGYFRGFKENKWEASLEFYYKDMNNQIAYKDNSNLFLNKYIERELRIGDGWSYGAELLVKKNSGDLSGWFAYTLSKSENQINGINSGKAFPSRFDKRHNISLYTNYNFSDRISLGCNFVYSTGNAITAPQGSFSYDGILVNRYTERNSYRLPDYHRLDLSLKCKGKDFKRLQTEWVFALYNVYNRKNAYSIHNKKPSSGYVNNQMYMIYLSGIIPSVTFRMKFK